MHNLLPENNEPILFELVNKITNERKRKALLQDQNLNMKMIKEIDPLLSEKQFKEQVKNHKANLEFLNHDRTIEQRIADQTLGKTAQIKK